jgi:hypothetical protein
MYKLYMHSTTELHLQPLVFFFFFCDRVSLCNPGLNLISSCLCLLNAGIIDMCYHSQLSCFLYLQILPLNLPSLSSLWMSSNLDTSQLTISSRNSLHCLLQKMLNPLAWCSSSSKQATKNFPQALLHFCPFMPLLLDLSDSVSYELHYSILCLDFSASIPLRLCMYVPSFCLVSLKFYLLLKVNHKSHFPRILTQDQ